MKKLVVHNEDLMLDWDWAKNNAEDLNPNFLTCGSHTIAHWKGHNCGHEWQAAIKNRSKGEGCPVCIGKKIVEGINDFGSNYPNLLKDWDYSKNATISPFSIYRYSVKRVWWKCHVCGHEWQTPVFKRSRGYGCPCCSRKVVVKGVNDFETLYPVLAKEWDYDKNEIKPYEVTPGSNKKAWWICLNGHDSYSAPVVNRTHGAGCPVCNTMFQTSFPEQAILFYVKKLFPEAINRYKDLFKTTMELDIYIPSINVAIEYDGAAWHKLSHSVQREQKKYDICKKNNIFLYRVREESNNKDNADKVYSVPAFSFSKLDLFNEMIKNLLQDISNNSNIDVNIGRDMFEILQYKIIKLEDSLACHFPELCKEWHPTLNRGLKPKNVLPGTTLKVWWKCQKCGNEWQASVNNRTKGHGCDVCANVQRKITYHKVRLETRELLIGCKCVEDWDYEKNEHNPDYYTKSSAEEVWWKCHKCGYEWKTAIFNRTRNGRKNDCPSCTKRILTRGLNDLLTTNPELVNAEWDYDLNKDIKPSDFHVSSPAPNFTLKTQGGINQNMQELLDRLFQPNKVLLCYRCGSSIYGLSEEESDKDYIVIIDGFDGCNVVKTDDSDFFVYGIGYFEKLKNFDRTCLTYFLVWIDNTLLAKDNVVYVDDSIKDKLDEFLYVDFKTHFKDWLYRLIAYFGIRLENYQDEKSLYHLYRVESIIKHYKETGKFEPYFSKENYELAKDLKTKLNIEKHLPRLKEIFSYIVNLYKEEES